jgi:hypothetical protein
MALAARFTDHHAMLCRLHRDQIKPHDHAIAKLDGQIADRADRWPRERTYGSPVWLPCQPGKPRTSL